VSRPALEVADIFRGHGAAWRRANAGHVSLDQLKVMSAIESCRTAALGGHVARCEKCSHMHIAYNSCRNRHCPKCQGAAAKEWLAEREAELLPVPYYHLVFTLPAAIADIAYQNKAVIYGILFKAAAETLITIAADPKHLGARIGLTAVLHTWGSALTHHPHVHIIVPGGGISLDGKLRDPSRVTVEDVCWFIDNPGIFVWEEVGRIVGFSAADPRDGSIFALFMDEAYEGRGIARALFERACSVLTDAGCPRMWLTTWPGTRAEQFYRKAGWHVTGVEDGNLVFEK
jgi:GNAT superfamily N-acetyltransferase